MKNILRYIIGFFFIVFGIRGIVTALPYFTSFNPGALLTGLAVSCFFIFIGYRCIRKKSDADPSSEETSSSADASPLESASCSAPQSTHSASYRYRPSARELRAMNDFLSPISSVPIYEMNGDGEYKKPLLVKDIIAMPHTNISKSTSSDKYFRYISLDIETTGLNATCEIIEVSAIKWIDSEPVEVFTTLCKSNKPIPVEAAKINHITDEMIENAPYFYNILPDLQSFISDFPLIGHNIDFDLKFLQRYGLDVSTEKRLFFDTLDLARKSIKKDNGGNYSDYRDRVFDYKLETIAKFFNIKCPVMHRSLCDAYVTGIIFQKLIARIVK